MLLIIKSLNFNAVNVNEIHIFNVVNIIYVVNVNAEEIVEITHNLLNMNIEHGHKYNICIKNNQRCLCRLSSNFASDLPKFILLFNKFTVNSLEELYLGYFDASY